MYDHIIRYKYNEKQKKIKSITTKYLLTAETIHQIYNVIEETKNTILAMNGNKHVIFKADINGLYRLISNGENVNVPIKKKPTVKLKHIEPKKWTVEEIEKKFFIYEKTKNQIIAFCDEKMAIFKSINNGLYIKTL